MEERVRIWDILLIASLVAVCFLVWFFPKPEGKTAVISRNGAVIAVCDLSEDRIVDLSNGMKAVVEDGSIRIEGAVCPDRLCEKTGRISSEGQVILCVPEGISVEIRGEEVDAVVG